MCSSAYVHSVLFTYALWTAASDFCYTAAAKVQEVVVWAPPYPEDLRSQGDIRWSLFGSYDAVGQERLLSPRYALMCRSIYSVSARLPQNHLRSVLPGLRQFSGNNCIAEGTSSKARQGKTTRTEPFPLVKHTAPKSHLLLYQRSAGVSCTYTVSCVDTLHRL